MIPRGPILLYSALTYNRTFQNIVAPRRSGDNIAVIDEGQFSTFLVSSAGRENELYCLLCTADAPLNSTDKGSNSRGTCLSCREKESSVRKSYAPLAVLMNLVLSVFV